MNWPRITVVTPSFNQAAFIEQTVTSVLDQGYPNLEYIVVDGGSTDGSVDIIRRYAKHLTYWVSEPDKGQSDAIVKGFARATGEVMNWLNSDDLLLPDALRKIGELYRRTDADMIVGQDHHFQGEASDVQYHFVPRGYAYPGCLRFWEGKFQYHQPCTYFTRAAYDRAGGLNIDLHAAMDFDLYVRMLRKPQTKVAYIAAPITAFRLHPAAKTTRNKNAFVKEMVAVVRRMGADARLDARDFAAMRRRTAELYLHNASAAAREGRSGASLLGLMSALMASPSHAFSYGFRRAFGVGAGA